MHVERKVTINSPVDKVYSVVSDFNHWTAWSPWLIMEPEATVNVADDAKYYDWEGKRVGFGNMKILKEDTNRRVDYDLNFLKPWKSNAKVSFILDSKGDKTDVIWTMDSSLPFFMFFMKKMMEGFVGMDYERGLNMLKEYVEDGEIKSQLEFVGTNSFDGFKYVGVKTETTIDELGTQMPSDFGKIEEFMKSNESIATGAAFSQYHKWDMVKKKVIYTSGVGVKEIPNDLPSDFVSGELPKTDIYTLRHVGSYDHLGNAWSTLYSMERNKELKCKKGIHPFEIYVNNPQEVAPKELITDINFALR